MREISKWIRDTWISKMALLLNTISKGEVDAMPGCGIYDGQVRETSLEN